VQSQSPAGHHNHSISVLEENTGTVQNKVQYFSQNFFFKVHIAYNWTQRVLSQLFQTLLKRKEINEEISEGGDLL
jgi:glutaminase